MPGITLNDIANDEVMNDTLPVLEFEEQVQQEKKSEMFGKLLTAETGEGSIGDYLEHPLNFNNSKGLAQTIRGITGIVGNLNLAIVDVVFGLLRFSRESKKGVNNVAVLNRGGIPS